jgi:hypothetical protein
VVVDILPDSVTLALSCILVEAEVNDALDAIVRNVSSWILAWSSMIAAALTPLIVVTAD